MNKNLFRDLRRALSTGRYEKSDGGILLRDARVVMGGAIATSFLFGPTFKERGHDTVVSDNLVTDQGLILALINALAGGIAITAWYLMPYKNNATPQSTWTGANVSANAGEFTNYTEANRPQIIFPDPTTIVAPSLSNVASLAVTTIDAGSDKTLWGGAVVANAAKSDATAGSKCFAAVKFAAARSGLQTGDGIGWQYMLTAASS